MAETDLLLEQGHFCAIVKRYQGPLLRYVRGSLGEHDAQDVVQEVFLRLHKAITDGGLRSAGGIATWLFRVAHNCAADVLRVKQKNQKASEAAVAQTARNDPAGDGLDEAVHREDCRLVFQLLDQLPAQQRQVVLLKIEQGLSYRDIGQVTGLALGTVGYLMNQGLQRLARELKAAGSV